MIIIKIVGCRPGETKPPDNSIAKLHSAERDVLHVPDGHSMPSFTLINAQTSLKHLVVAVTAKMQALHVSHGTFPVGRRSKAAGRAKTTAAGIRWTNLPRSGMV